MPSFVIHIASGNEYLKKYKNDIKNKKEFLDGIIAPDLIKNKRASHYGSSEEKESLINYLKNNKNTLTNDFKKGYFLHLYADFVMYSKYFPKVPLYNDYDIITEYIVNKYNVKLPEKLSKYGKFKEGELTYLSYEFLDKFIEEVIEKDIYQIIKEMEEEYEYKD